MADTAMHLSDKVFPQVPTRQWVLSLPHAVRYLMVRDPELCKHIRGIFLRTVQSFYVRRARKQGITKSRAGGICAVQRFDSALRLDLHFHAILLDGVYTGFDNKAPLTFQAATPITDAEIHSLTRHIHNLIQGHLIREGYFTEDLNLQDPPSELDELHTCHAAGIQGLIPFGERQGQRCPTVALNEFAPPPDPNLRSKKLCSNHQGYSLHAAVYIGADAIQKRERLFRYITRPPFAQDRIHLSPRGDIIYRFKKAWRNGKDCVVMDPMTFIARLAAQIPPPRFHMLTYHGVLAPAAARRSEIIPEVDPDEQDPTPLPPQTKPPAKTKRQRAKWSTLLQRVFGFDALLCSCGARRRVLTMVQSYDSIQRVLKHLGLPTEPPERSPPKDIPGALNLWAQ